MEIFMDSISELKGEILTIVGVCAAVVLAAVGTIGGDAAIAFIGGCLFKNPVARAINKEL
tara:strand:+ start:8750 stop:8929 length:180 start_codon:yes stop_codon:yes gene_type:complete